MKKWGEAIKTEDIERITYCKDSWENNEGAGYLNKGYYMNKWLNTGLDKYLGNRYGFEEKHAKRAKKLEDIYLKLVKTIKIRKTWKE